MTKPTKQEEIGSIRQEGLTLIFVTLHLEEAILLADRDLVLHKEMGQIPRLARPLRRGAPKLAIPGASDRHPLTGVEQPLAPLRQLAPVTDQAQFAFAIRSMIYRIWRATGLQTDGLDRNSAIGHLDFQFACLIPVAEVKLAEKKASLATVSVRTSKPSIFDGFCIARLRW